MFNWNQTTILNSAKDLNGKDKVTVVTDTKNAKNKGLRIAKYHTFWADKVVSMHTNPSVEPKKGSVTITLSDSSTEAGEIYRIKLYARLSGSNNSYYANDFVFKGKPFVFEFEGGVSGADLAKKFKSILAAYDDPFLTITNDGNAITFTGDNYTLFTEAKVEHFVEEPRNVMGGIWENAGVSEPTITKCENGFGTYEQITKDLRLPTMEARAFGALNSEEMPIPGATYSQVTIIYCADRGVQGLQAIGEPVKSQTVHSFYVNDAIMSDFTAKLEEAGISENEEEAGE
jgi:hypothetical protein